jgi:hypothetical protein
MNEPDGALKNLLETSPLFKDSGVEFYPLFQAHQEIRRQLATLPAGVSLREEVMFAKMSPIRIYKEKKQKEIYVLDDKYTHENVHLVYDKDVEIRVGRAHAEKLGLHRGALRRISVHHSGDLAEHVTFHVIQLGKDKIVGVHHRGCIYVSKLALLEVRNALEQERDAEAKRRRDGTRDSVNSKFFLWNVAENQEGISTDVNALAGKQQPIERGFGFGGGLLLGAGVGALAGATLARPYAYYPPPAYPYYYRRPYGYYPPPPPLYY